MENIHQPGPKEIFSPGDIADCYRMFLEREPETYDVVREKVLSIQTISHLIQDFIHSDEYREKHRSKGYLDEVGERYNPPAQRVEVGIDNELMAKLFDRVRRQWQKLGDSQPYWSVITHPDFEMKNIEDNKDNFFRSGVWDANGIQSFFSRNSLTLPTGTCLELGCGVGRVTYYLSKMFERVIGLDISSGNLAIASQHLAKAGVANATLTQLKAIEDFDDIPNYDFMYSIIVLQHNTPPVQKIVLDKVLSKMNRGGGCLFQIATEIPGYHFTAEEYLNSPPAVMEMHALPMRIVFELLAKHKIPLVEVRPDGLTGFYGSYTFLAHGKEHAPVAATRPFAERFMKLNSASRVLQSGIDRLPARLRRARTAKAPAGK